MPLVPPAIVTLSRGGRRLPSLYQRKWLTMGRKGTALLAPSEREKVAK